MTTVLIADDSNIVRKTIKDFLKALPEVDECREASDGREAVECAQAIKPDLIVLDLGMPKMSGLEVARVLKSSMPGVPIVLFTMYNVSKWAEDLGVDAVVTKPDGLNQLVDCVRSLLHRSHGETQAS